MLLNVNSIHSVELNDYLLCYVQSGHIMDRTYCIWFMWHSWDREMLDAGQSDERRR
jgi:hypothetical protein